VCDAIAVNWLALTVSAARPGARARFPGERMPARAAAVLLVGGVPPRCSSGIEPRCLRGPYAMMDAAVWPIWLAHVREMKPDGSRWAEDPLIGIAIATFPAVALHRRTRPRARSSRCAAIFPSSPATAAFVMASVTTFAAIKASSYATWLGMPLVAVFALHLFRLMRLQSTGAARRRRRAAHAGGAVARRDHHRESRPASVRATASSRETGTLLQDRELSGARATSARADREPTSNYGSFSAGAHAHYYGLPRRITGSRAGNPRRASRLRGPFDQARGMLRYVQAGMWRSCGAQAPDGVARRGTPASGAPAVGAGACWLEPLPSPAPSRSIA
jgi:hypothetical protein